MTEQSIFKEIPGYEGRYEINNQGFIRNIKTKHVLKPYKQKNGYLRINLRNRSGITGFLVHRLVWITFKGDIPCGLEVNHKKENKDNNSLDNLELLNHIDNINYGDCIARHSRAVVQCDMDGNFIAYHDGIRQAAAALGKPGARGGIFNCCRKKNHHAYGYKWLYFDELDPITKLKVVALDDIKK